MRLDKVVVIISLVVGLGIFMPSSLSANGFLKEATNKPVLVQQGENKHWCSICGMKLKMFYKTSHIAHLKNDIKKQYCSIRCLVLDKEKNNIDISKIEVVDVKTEKIIDAKKAFYLVGSQIAGTMSMKSKLAFEFKKDALEFQSKYQGKIVNFKTAYDMAKKSLEKDIMMVTKKKEKKVYPMGKKLYSKMCSQELDMSGLVDIGQLKAYLLEKKICKQLQEKKLHAVALYLWEVKRLEGLVNKENTLKMYVGKDEKCPVCGMYVYKFPKWMAQIYFTHGDHEHHFSFDGVKDMMKFYLEPKKWGNYELYSTEKISKILVTDYYTQKTIDGTKAFYVTSSDITGPMGHELIPFENENDAKTFLKDHFGKSILKFEEINIDKINNLGLK